jgi:hypothetical protein
MSVTFIERSGICSLSAGMLSVCQAAANKQLQRTVKRHRERTAGAPFHYAPTVRWTRQRTAAELRR